MKWTRFSEKKPPMEISLLIKESANGFKRMGNWYYDDETGYNLYIATTGAYEGWIINQDNIGFDDYLWLDESESPSPDPLAVNGWISVEKGNAVLTCKLKVGDSVVLRKLFGGKIGGKEAIIESIRHTRNCESGFVIKINIYDSEIDANWVTPLPAPPKQVNEK